MLFNRRRQALVIFFALLIFGARPFAADRQPDFAEIAKHVQAFRKDRRGPFQGIRWFCPDRTVIPARERCEQSGGIQHALQKDIVLRWRTDHHIFLGQILAGTPFVDFLDEDHNNARLKQYQLEKFLQATDDGWIMRRARYYRGAYQAEDESAWGNDFLKYLLSQDKILEEQFFLVRQAVKDIPHNGNDDKSTQIRALAKTIADSLPGFMDLRVKIHGRPDASDLDSVREFRASNREEIWPSLAAKFQRLADGMAAVYAESGVESLRKYLALIPLQYPVGLELSNLVLGKGTPEDGFRTSASKIASLLITIRRHLPNTQSAEIRLALMDLSSELEAIQFRNIARWQTRTLGELLEKNYVLAKSAAGCGFFEVWEWERLETELLLPQTQRDVKLDKLLALTKTTNRSIEWGTRMVQAVYGHEVALFSHFEPLVHSFIDDRTRSSILLPYGELASKLAEISNKYSGVSMHLLDLAGQNQVLGLNPGFTKGELVVVTGLQAEVVFSQNKIYAMRRAPGDLKPVAGILTVSEGNAVSHVQLLARNLGIPNANISLGNLEDLAKYSGKTVFYAVSDRGSVVMKLASEMTLEETTLVAETQEQGNRHKIAIPTDEIDLDQTEILRLSNLRSSDSGRICGPKAANLGQLKAIFPEKVVPGLVIPFGVFRAHMAQRIPDTNVTYWQFLQAIFAQAGQDRERGVPENTVEDRVLARLGRLRAAIEKMQLLPGFLTALQDDFHREFGVELGELPIFIRSDTNMEDLQEFTGAGLNLTVFNIRDREEILQSIRRVWASPFTERSFKWRQKYLLNPENVYPSLLLLPSVNVEKSGVVITTGIFSSNPDDMVVAMNWGGGGAVEGQAAETYLLVSDGRDLLIYPAREPEYLYLPDEGGVSRRSVHFNEAILTKSDRTKLRLLAADIRRILPGMPGIETKGPFDIELGFWHDQIWLFQVRPFVENKLAQSSSYLNRLDFVVDLNRSISLSAPFQI